MADYINRADLGIGKANRKIFKVPEYADGWNEALDYIFAFPSEDVAPVRRGRWMVDGCDAMCSNCRNIFCGDWDELDLIADCGMRYCPNCGARMTGEEEPK